MQDFWNVAADDPLVHFARFFYGPMLQGRDGMGAAPCCGTGVVFRRDVLVSIGGQAYGSITEVSNDCTDTGVTGHQAAVAASGLQPLL
jgi:cellulose synthase (UDP-forming)